MGDPPDRPFYDPRYVARPAKTRPAERLWALQKRDHAIAGELRYHGESGVEAQLLRDGELLAGRRFDMRALAVQWLDFERGALEAAPRKLRALIALALITGARVGELLALTWASCADGAITFLETKNGRPRRIPISPAMRAVLDSLPTIHAWVLTNPTTAAPYTVNGCAHVFRRAVRRAGLAHPHEVAAHAAAYRRQSHDRDGAR